MPSSLLVRLLPIAGAIVAASPASAQFYGILKQRDFVQTSPAEPVPLAATPARFGALLPPNTAGSLRTPAGVTTPIAVNAEFEVRYPSVAAMETAYPPGTYTLTVGATPVALTMTANPYPADLPRVLGGTWTAGGQLIVDPAREYTLNFSLHSDYGRAGAVTNIRVSIFQGEGQVLLEQEIFSNATPTPITSIVIPAGRMVAGRTYAAEIQFLNLSTNNTTAVPGSTGVVGGVFETDFVITTVAQPNAAPVIARQPAAQTITAGGTVAFFVQATGTPAPTYQWRRSGVNIAGETRPYLVLSGPAATAGAYSCVVSNAAGSVASADATLTLANVAPAAAGRLINLSVLAPTGPGEQLLTMGATVGGAGAAGVLPLVIRGVGPTLSGPPFNVGGVLADPVLAIYPAGSATPSATNDDWGGTPALVDAFAGVGAFTLPAASRDSAALQAQAAGGFTVQVAGKAGASGTVIAEVYDSAGGQRTGTTPRLTNLSTLTSVAAGDALTVGFAIGGTTARTVLVRAVGPTLGGAPFNLGGTMADPLLQLFDNARGAQILQNDNWGGAPWLISTGASVGAFALAGVGTRDAALLITLPPGTYSARVSGVGGGGTAIVEVYEVP